jgi:hypothetical protein
MSCGLWLSSYIDASHFWEQSMRALDEFIFERDHFRDHGGRAMRIRISAVLAAALVWGTGAFAADMPVKAPPVVATVFSWTGFYVGGHAGYAWGEPIRRR